MEKYHLHNRHDIPKEYECCWNCKYMAWQVGIGMGVRCTNIKNQYRVFVGKQKIKTPIIPGVAKKCEHFCSNHSEK